MPGFVSHTVMAHDVYKYIDNKDVNLDTMMTYSLGGDLCKYAKCRYDSHHRDKDKFIYTMADYIKEHNLINDKEIMGVLYGHRCHFIMDSVVHPLVRCACNKNKRNHTLIEVYYDSYLVNKVFNINKKEYLNKIKLCSSKDNEINKMIDRVYKDIYDKNNVSKYYRFNLFLYRRLRNIYLLFSNNFINRIIGLNKYLKVNNDLCNDRCSYSYKDYLGALDNANLDELYLISVEVAIEYIKNINKYLKS